MVDINVTCIATLNRFVGFIWIGLMEFYRLD
jgi:hypothetical protein